VPRQDSPILEGKKIFHNLYVMVKILPIKISEYLNNPENFLVNF
jgi:hypothetical protein